MNNKQSHHVQQSGSFLLILVLVLGIISTLALSAYLTLLTHTTQTITGRLQAEQIHYATFAGFSETISQIIQTPNWITNNLGNSMYKYANTNIDRQINQNADLYTLDFTATGIHQIKRRLVADFQADLTPLDIVLVIDTSTSMDNEGCLTQPSCTLPSNYQCQPLATALCASIEFINYFKHHSYTYITAIQYGKKAATLTPPHNQLVSQDLFDDLQYKISLLTATGDASNLGGAIKLAHQIQLASPRWNDGITQHHIIILTDGYPAFPERFDELDPDEQAEPDLRGIPPGALKENYAKAKAKNAKGDDIIITAIGVSDDINEFLLKNFIATSASQHYYPASEIKDIYPIFQQIISQISNPNILTLREEPPE